jgi:hypothetical protein
VASFNFFFSIFLNERKDDFHEYSTISTRVSARKKYLGGGGGDSKPSHS